MYNLSHISPVYSQAVIPDSISFSSTNVRTFRKILLNDSDLPCESVIILVYSYDALYFSSSFNPTICCTSSNGGIEIIIASSITLAKSFLEIPFLHRTSLYSACSGNNSYCYLLVKRSIMVLNIVFTESIVILGYFLCKKVPISCSTISLWLGIDKIVLI